MALKPTNDPKYGINEEGKICNIATQKPISDDEPIFILRAQDSLAEQTIHFYISMVPTNEHSDGVYSRIIDFRNFRQSNPSRMKAPDTVYPYPKIVE